MDIGTGQPLKYSAKILSLEDYREKRRKAEGEESPVKQLPTIPWPSGIAWIPVCWMPVVLWPLPQTETQTETHLHK